MQTAIRRALIVAILLKGSMAVAIAQDKSRPQPVPPPSTNLVGRSGRVALNSVFRVLCRSQNRAGTGFLHKSGDIITADHVIRECSDPSILDANGNEIPVSITAIDEDVDLAALKPDKAMSCPCFDVLNAGELAVGDQVTTWGFPSGYNGRPPMLSVGYLSGLDAAKRDDGKVIKEWVINAAFNHGNSGGPLIEVDSGKVIGVVNSKLAPLSEFSTQALSLLQHQPSGFQYPAIKDGKPVSLSEAQVAAAVLDDLRSQVQLVIGEATVNGDLRDFLKRNKIDP